MNKQEKISDEDWAKAAEGLIADLIRRLGRLEYRNEELRGLLKESRVYRCRCCNSYKAKGLPGPAHDGCANCRSGEGDMVLIEDPGMLLMEMEEEVKACKSCIEQVRKFTFEAEGEARFFTDEAGAFATFIRSFIDSFNIIEKGPDSKTFERVPVQAQHDKPAGSIAWSEHFLIWEMYAKKNGAQTAERIAERGGFGYSEACNLLGRDLETWEPR